VIGEKHRARARVLNFVFKRHRNSHTCICNFKTFSEGYTPDPILKGSREKGREGWQWKGGMSRKGRWRVGEGCEKEGGREEGRQREDGVGPGSQ
jgi:hypothetical protein